MLGSLPFEDMENWFYMEAKLFVFSVGLGTAKLKVVKKRKALVGVVLLGSRCIVWLLSMLEEALRNPGFEDFVKSNREGSKATIVRRASSHKSGHFLEVAVYDVGGQKGLVLFPKGRDGWGWSRDLGELSKVYAFFEDAGKTMGKAARSLLFVEVVCMVAPVFVKGNGKQRSAAYIVSKLVERGRQWLVVIRRSIFRWGWSARRWNDSQWIVMLWRSICFSL